MALVSCCGVSGSEGAVVARVETCALAARAGERGTTGSGVGSGVGAAMGFRANTKTSGRRSCRRARDSSACVDGVSLVSLLVPLRMAQWLSLVSFLSSSTAAERTIGGHIPS